MSCAWDLAFRSMVSIARSLEFRPKLAAHQKAAPSNNGSHRSPQFMTDGGNEFILGAVGLFCLTSCLLCLAKRLAFPDDRALLFRDVTRDLGSADDSAEAVLDRRYGQGDIDRGSRLF